MSRYEIPGEPHVDRLWSTDPQTGEPIEWRRFKDEAGGWGRTDQAGCITWRELIEQGPLFDIHPDLYDAPGFPWKVVDGDIESAGGTPLLNIAYEAPRGVAELVVRVMNDWAAAL